MELKEYVKIIKQHKMLFGGIWIFIAIIAFIWVFSQPESFNATMSIDIARQGAQNDSETVREYDYDQFYRLEADDRFANTVVQWLKDPGVVNSIYADSKLKAPSDSLRSLSKAFRAEKLAPNYIQIKYSATDPSNAGVIFRATEKIITKRTNSLNADAQDQNWFKTIFSGPIVAKKKLPVLPVAVGVIAGGFLVSIFGVMVRHYWREEDN